MNLKQPLLLTCFIFAFLFSSIAQTVYVKHDATGANNGSSWTDAFTDVQTALDNATAGSQLWIAAGTYKPGGVTPNPTVFYSMPTNLELYGGFAGTETTLSQRDWVNNFSIFSGDHNNDDIMDDYTTNRSDNAMHIMWLDTNINNATIIDGIYFRNGQTADVNGSGNDRRGAAILTYGAPIIKNCQFEQNFGWFGAVYPRASGASGTQIIDSKFIKNSGGSGGGIFTVSNTDLVISGCEFLANIANYGGGLYQSALDNAKIDNCTFLDNTVNNRGGGMYSNNSNYVLSNSTFDGNMAPNSSGGGLHNGANSPVTGNIKNSDFMNNESGWGAGITNYGEGLQTNIDSCTFENNTAAVSGGGVSNGFLAACLITNSELKQNKARFGAGAFCQNDTTQLTVDNVVFDSNEGAVSSSSTFGGGIGISAGTELLVSNSTFVDNHSNFGGAINISEDTTVDRSFLKIDNSYFYTNLADNQGGALNIFNADLELTNCVFGGNTNLSTTGGGGAISINAFDGDTQMTSIVNSSFGNNLAPIGAGISHYTDSFSTSMISLQNSIFENAQFGVNYTVEAGAPTVVSQGGNLSSDGTLAGALTNTNDINNLDPEFEDINNLDLHLKTSSPCIDQGIAGGAPVLDIEGKVRLGIVDMGAYEWYPSVNNESATELTLTATIFPNPTADHLTVELDNEWTGKMIFSILGMNGTLLEEKTVHKLQETVSLKFDLKGIPNGIYELRISHNGKQYAKPFVKGQ